MRDDILPRSLGALIDADLLDRAFEPEFMRQRTPLEVELLWRLAALQQAIELAQADQRRMRADLWALEYGEKTAREQATPPVPVPSSPRDSQRVSTLK